MRIKRITVKKYKNLNDFDCVFSDSNISAFIGNNGAGKSNILELITRAFSNAMNYYCSKNLPIIYVDDEPSVIDCTIEYELKGKTYQLIYNDNIFDIIEDARLNDKRFVYEYVKILCDGKRVAKSGYLEALPSSILLYYAGETNRQKNQSENTYDSVYDYRLKKMESDDLPELKYMDYYSIDDLSLLLLVLSVYKGELYERILELLDCKEITPEFSIVLGKPDKGKGSADTYWDSKGFVKYFLERLRKFVSKTEDAGQKYFMFFNEAEQLQSCADNEFELFSKLKALKNYGILKHIGIGLEKINGVKFSQSRLSEGEKQLCLLLLLTSFTSKTDCLYLFDEFDAYLHLNWQRNFSNVITTLDVLGHILFTTHSPATISTMKRQNVFVMNNGKAHSARSDTFNRSLDEIMEEQMFVTMRPKAFTDLEKDFRNAIMHNQKDLAIAKLEQIREIVGDDDPFFITASMALRRME